MTLRRSALSLHLLLLVACWVACSAACSGASPPVPTGAADMAHVPDPLIVARPYQSHAPGNYDPTKSYPLVILLHGYGVNGITQDLYWAMDAASDEKRFLLAYPDGTKDMRGSRFWNATDNCCNFDNLPVDDVAYLDAVIADMSALYNVDAKRIYVTGHSNGGYMSYRYACERADKIAAAVILAGLMWKDVTKCPAKGRVAIAHVHGDMDMSVPYNGGANAPSAMQSVADWARIDGCTGTLGAATTLDLDDKLPGAETTVQKWSACPATVGDSAAELWTIQGAGHVPSFTSTWAPTISDWMLSHHK